MNSTDLQSANKMSQLRRSQRVCLRLPILVLREGTGSNVASEETHTLIVNAHGALVQLGLTVVMGQILGIKNLQTMEQLVCRVVHLGPDQVGKKEVGIEFETPSPRFWRVTFPPVDWTPRSPEAKAPTKYVPGGRPLVQKVDVPAGGGEKKKTTKLPGQG